MRLFIEFYLGHSLKFESPVVIFRLGKFTVRPCHGVNLYAGGYRIASVHNGAPCRGSAPDTATWIDEMQSTDGVATPRSRSPSSHRMAGRPAGVAICERKRNYRPNTGQTPLVFALARRSRTNNWVSAYIFRTYRSIINDRNDSNRLRRSRA